MISCLHLTCLFNFNFNFFWPLIQIVLKINAPIPGSIDSVNPSPENYRDHKNFRRTRFTGSVLSHPLLGALIFSSFMNFACAQILITSYLLNILQSFASTHIQIIFLPEPLMSQRKIIIGTFFEIETSILNTLWTILRVYLRTFMKRPRCGNLIDHYVQLSKVRCENLKSSKTFIQEREWVRSSRVTTF